MIESIIHLLKGVTLIEILFLDQICTIDGVEVTGEEIKEALIDNAIYKKRIGDSE